MYTSRQVYAEHVYNARCYSFCCLKWRHLVKFLPLDNAASKLKPNGLLTVILTYTPKQPGSESGGLCCLGSASGDGLPPQNVHVCTRTKTCIVTAWQQLSRAFLDRSIGEWRRRLENVIQCNGGQSSMFVELKSTTLVLWT